MTTTELYQKAFEIGQSFNGLTVADAKFILMHLMTALEGGAVISYDSDPFLESGQSLNHTSNSQ